MLLTAAVCRAQDSFAVCRAQEPYAYTVISGDTLTFYFDYKNYSDGNFVAMRESFSTGLNSQLWWVKDSINIVIFDKSIQYYRPVSCKDWFRGLRNIKKIEGLEYLNTEEVRDMSGMFSGCQKLESLNLSNFNTSNVINMCSMFADCTSLKSLNLKNFDTKQCRNIRLMFSQCSALKKVDVSSFDTQNIEGGVFQGMFEGCKSLTDLDVSNFIIGSFCDIDGMFMGCSSLKNLTLFELEKDGFGCGISMSSIFNGCKSLETLDLSGWDIDSPFSMNRAFANCTNLKTIYVSENWQFVYRKEVGVDPIDESSKIMECPYDFYHVFYNCPNLTGGAGTKWNPNDVSTPTYLKIDVAEEVLHDVEIDNLDGTTTFYKEFVKQKAVPGYFTLKE